MAAKGDGAVRRRTKVLELDPESYCGSRTTVMQLFRVEAQNDNGPQKHLVFRDRHGLYCEHGMQCLAVELVVQSGMLIPANSLEWTT
jgi:hypothetical protein